MLTLSTKKSFEKDLKKYNHNALILNALNEVIELLLSGSKLPKKYNDHDLGGNWNNSRDCHIKPDVVLIYRILKKEKLLILERIGSHSELFK